MPGGYAEPQVRPFGPMLDSLYRSPLDAVDSLTYTPEPGEVIDPAQQGINDQDDNCDGYREQQDTPLITIDART